MTTWTLQDYTPEEDEAWAMLEKEQEYLQLKQQQKEKRDDMYWNNRIVKETIKYLHEGKELTEYYYEISEVYYNDKDEPCGYCKATLGGETLDELRDVYIRLADAFSQEKPVLDAETDFKNKFTEDEEDGKEI
jgi:predicted subunit of tRNA(5-methylaminomethyl-2-thiouridylate) methyltransferase